MTSTLSNRHAGVARAIGMRTSETGRKCWHGVANARSVRRLGPVAVGSALLLLAAACGSQGAASGAQGTVTFAMNQGAGVVDYLFPITDFASFTASNLQANGMMYPPLYTFGYSASTDNSLSLGKAPVYSNNDTTVSITLKPFKWSDGTPVTARDITFFLNLLKVSKTDWAKYVPGGIPDDIASATITSPRTLTLTLSSPVAPSWFTQTQLSEIIPLPQQAWDRTSASGKVGNYDQTASGATAVYKYLTRETADLGTYASDPLWKVVDGAWRLSAYRTDGYAAFSPNPDYSGPIKPSIRTFELVPFQSDAAEYNELEAGDLTYGYVPMSDLADIPTVKSRGYTVMPWYDLSIDFLLVNYNNPTIGPVFKQLYFRQLLQSSINQSAYIKAFQGGFGTPTYGPVPLKPSNPYITAYEKSDPNPFDPAKARALLVAHGWAIHAGAVTVCSRPGTAANECGAGIPKGLPLRLSLDYLSGTPYLAQEMLALRSQLATIGIQVSLSTGDSAQVSDAAIPCHGSSCTWQMIQWGTPAWTWQMPYPVGGQLFATNAGTNPGGYSDSTADSLISAVQDAKSPAVFARYENYIAQQLPMLWIPNVPDQVSAISKSLHGAMPQGTLGMIAPQLWKLDK
jgi:peptide/nickel transport system substrate-binding protein